MGGFGKLMRPMAEYTSEVLCPFSNRTGPAVRETPSSCPLVLAPTAAPVEMADMTNERGVEDSPGVGSAEFQCGLMVFITSSHASDDSGTADARVDTSPIVRRGEEEPLDAAVIWD